MTPYLRYQFEWCYVPNTAAGQDIRILDTTETPAAAALVKVGALAVVEGRHVARLRYDAGGDYQGATAAGDDAAVCHVTLAEVAWNLATPFTIWWAEHLQYHRHNAAA